MHNADTLNICMKEFVSQKLIIDKMTVMRTWTIFLDCVRGYSSTCAMIVQTRADQLLFCIFLWPLYSDIIFFIDQYCAGGIK